MHRYILKPFVQAHPSNHCILSVMCNSIITYIHPYQYNAKVNRDGFHYNCGVELTPEGQFGRKEYMKHAMRGTYTLHSLYLLLWANFGAFCMALLTQPEAEAGICGPIISQWLSVRAYCVSQLRIMWTHMRNNLGLSDEERAFLVFCCTKQLYEVCNRHCSRVNLCCFSH